MSSKACGQDQTLEQIYVCQAIKIKNNKRKYTECKEIKENYRDISFAFLTYEANLEPEKA
jgi:hypothetical protein